MSSDASLLKSQISACSRGAVIIQAQWGRATPIWIRESEGKHTCSLTQIQRDRHTLAWISVVVICLQLIKDSRWISCEPADSHSIYSVCVCVPVSLLPPLILLWHGKHTHTHAHTCWILPSIDQVIMLLYSELSSGCPRQRWGGRAEGRNRGREEDDHGWKWGECMLKKTTCRAAANGCFQHWFLFIFVQ